MSKTTRTPIFDERYEYPEKLGEGGFGILYKARHKVLKRIDVIKLLPPTLLQDDDAMQRFEREAAALGQLGLDNDYVVRVYDASVEQRFPHIVMEFVEGKDLRKVLQERERLSVEEVIQLGVEMAEALAHVQQVGIVHRDVKPSNIMIRPDGRAKLTDFGEAIAETLPRYTQKGGLIGTYEYMSPEQVDGLEELDGRSDLYSLGIVLYECLTGNVPFKQERASPKAFSDLLMHIQEKPVQPITRSDVPSWLSEIIDRCLAKKPEDRFSDGEELATKLKRELERVEEDMRQLLMTGTEQLLKTRTETLLKLRQLLPLERRNQQISVANPVRVGNPDWRSEYERLKKETRELDERIEVLAERNEELKLKYEIIASLSLYLRKLGSPKNIKRLPYYPTKLGSNKNIERLLDYMRQGERNLFDCANNPTIPAIVSALIQHSLVQLTQAYATNNDALKKAMYANLYNIAKRFQKFHEIPLHGFMSALAHLEQRGPPEIASYAGQLKPSLDHHLDQKKFQDMLKMLRDQEEVELIPFFFDVDDDGRVFGFS